MLSEIKKKHKSIFTTVVSKINQIKIIFFFCINTNFIEPKQKEINTTNQTENDKETKRDKMNRILKSNLIHKSITKMVRSV